ncbi:MAG: hypothetical protein PHG66_01650 [Candidatus Colwellbacteria bacterium]|nr:hypothetical protein [Candidatus Colwellbacteria bacterium]
MSSSVAEALSELAAKEAAQAAAELAAKEAADALANVSATAAETAAKVAAKNAAATVAETAAAEVAAAAAKVAAAQAVESAAESAATAAAKTTAGKTLANDIASVSAKELATAPDSVIKDFITSHAGAITLIGLTGVGAALYFGIEAAKGKSPSNAYNDLVQGAADTTKDIVGVANSAAAAVLAPIANASGLTGFIDAIKNFISKYKIIFIVIVVLCILSSMSAIVLKFT